MEQDFSCRFFDPVNPVDPVKKVSCTKKHALYSTVTDFAKLRG